MLNDLQIQPFPEGFHLAIPQGTFAGLPVALGGRAHNSGGLLHIVPVYLLVTTGRFKQPAPRYLTLIQNEGGFTLPPCLLQAGAS
ncbi:hypothetical protein [Nitrosococcus oceani]|uniref:hypothetical protein n=1 Tax=Nitrosococcus oceani TaxID=1229 RepID=UPI000ACDF309|nr:hypothetical protein [Nitrosococcus oceani]